MNSREKGKRGERQWRDELRAEGYDARRGQQFSGGADSPDVVCDSLPWIHFEVKAVERLNIEEAMEQARRDAGKCSVSSVKYSVPKVPVVAHKRSFRPWLVTMEAKTFFKLLRGDFVNRQTREMWTAASEKDLPRKTPNTRKGVTEANGGNRDQAFEPLIDANQRESEGRDRMSAEENSGI